MNWSFELIATQTPVGEVGGSLIDFRLLSMVLAFVAVTAVTWLTAVIILRFRRAAQGVGSTGVSGANDGPLGPWAAAMAAQIPESKRESTEFQKLLRAAGFYQPHAAKTVYAMRFLLFVLPLVVAGVCATIAPREATFRIVFIGGMAAFALSIVPRLYVRWRRNRRQAAIRRTLPDALDMLGMCVDGGMPLSPALSYVAGQLSHAPELAEELAILRRQADVSSLKSALNDFADRVQIPEARQLSSLLSRSSRLGKQVAGSLLDHADRLRASRRQAATRRANKTPVKLVLPIMLCLAPAALILLVSPAVIELKEFISPTEGFGVLTENESLNTRSIFGTLDGLSQSFDIPSQNGS